MSLPDKERLRAEIVGDIVTHRKDGFVGFVACGLGAFLKFTLSPGMEANACGALAILGGLYWLRECIYAAANIAAHRHLTITEYAMPQAVAFGVCAGLQVAHADETDEGDSEGWEFQSTESGERQDIGVDQAEH